MPLIAYVGPFSFPNGGAAARRILGNAKSLKAAGYDVTIVTGQMPNGQPTEFEGFEVHSTGERTGEHLPSFLKHIKYLTIGKKTIRWLDGMENKPSFIILYSGYSPYFMRLIPWCRRNNVTLIFDAVEWYDAVSKLKLLLSPYYWNIELAMRYYSVKVKNIIAISSYLQKYYVSKHGNVIVVPPTVDLEEIAANTGESKNEKITIAYTGTPGHKDLFDNYLEAMLRIDPDGQKLIFRVAGLTGADILSYAAMQKRNIKDLPPCIQTIGKVSHSEAVDLVRQADFSVLLRKPERMAQAGFPTKFVESMSAGTPVIANLTSDLHLYLRNGETGIVCDDHSPESLIKALETICRSSLRERTAMRVNARKTAEEYFDYRIYTEKFKQYLTVIDPKQ
ncbi:MAG: glycosyltransferase family 4 protein [Bacteroidetes bacterium]|nr:glycosyltransferase family 4 protein [Bacteroidota bacterium]